MYHHILRVRLYGANSTFSQQVKIRSALPINEILLSTEIVLETCHTISVIHGKIYRSKINGIVPIFETLVLEGLKKIEK